MSIRLIELFSGYGSQALALKYLGVEFTHWRTCEWATKSIQAYNDLHIRDYTDYSKEFDSDTIVKLLATYGISMDYNKPMTLDQIKHKGEAWQRKTYNNIIATHNLVNISKANAEDLNIVETDKYDYILSYSYPCQDLSLAGKGAGMEKGSGTRSSLLWEVERLLSELDEIPQMLLMENVPQVNSPKNRKNFEAWQQKLEDLGYTNYIKILNAKDYNIPQNRQRCFMVSILGNKPFNFPKGMKLTKDLSTMLDPSVDDSFIISNNKIKELIKPVETDEITLKQVIQLKGKFESIGRVYSIDGLAPTINTCGGGQREPKICQQAVVINSSNKRLIKLVKNTEFKENETLFLDAYNQTAKDNIAGTITTRVSDSNSTFVYKDFIIRKLTPNECWRLMGVKDIDYKNVAANQSKSSLYHLAGDSIVTTVLMGIFGELLGLDYESKIIELVDSLKECN